MGTIARHGVLVAFLGIGWLFQVSDARSADPAELRLKFRVGQSSRYVSKVLTIHRRVGEDRDETQHMTETTVFSLEVTSVDAQGVAKVGQTNERTRLDISNPEASLHFDSADKDNPTDGGMFAMVYGAMIGQTVVRTVNPRGEAESITFPRALLEAFGVKEERMQAQFKSDPILLLFVPGHLYLPEKPLAVDKSLEERKRLEHQKGEINCRIEYARKPAELVDGRELERIDYAVQFEPESLERLNAMKYEISGTALLDLQQSEFVDVEFSHTTVMDLGVFIAEVSGKRTTRLLAADEDPFAAKQDK